jgi:hypothetical protein
VSQDAWDLVSNERARARRGAGGLVDALVASVQGALTSDLRMGTRFINLEHFALEHGYHWKLDTKRPLPKGFRAGKPGQCHANAANLATKHADVVYVEGFVLSGVMPIRHAWIQLPSGEAVDTTFAGLEHVQVAEYFGVPFKTDFVLKKTLEAGAYLTLLDNWQDRWPLLSASEEELVEMLWVPPEPAAAPTASPRPRRRRKGGPRRRAPG